MARFDTRRALIAGLVLVLISTVSAAAYSDGMTGPVVILAVSLVVVVVVVASLQFANHRNRGDTA